MKYIIFFQILFLITSCCDDPASNCAADEISYGEIDCIKREGYTFYEAKVNFYCLDVSLLFGLDISKARISPYYISTKNPVNYAIMSNRAEINYLNCTYCGFAIECTINNKYHATWVVIEDKAQFDTNPAVIKAKLLLKESVDFSTPTLDEMEIELVKRE